MNSARKAVFPSLCLTLLLLPQLLLAAPLQPIPGVPSKSLDAVLSDITGWLIGFSILICLLLIIWGSINYVAALGDDQRTTQAKKTIHYAIFGLLIIALSYSILKVIDSVLK
jgi:hypothetical protein